MTPEENNGSHWKTELDADGILWLRLDRADRDVNTLSRAVLEELEKILDSISLQQPTGIVICSSKKSGFIAGADVTEFASVADSSQARDHIERVHVIFNQLENLPIPTVCLIRGFCMGGGLELALACRYRIAVDSPDTRLSLPEVRLGIHPGFGGTVRLIRLIGPRKGLELMLSGGSIRARQALRTGVVDYVVPERQWEQAVRTVLSRPYSKRKFGRLRYLYKLSFLRYLMAWFLRRIIARKVNRKHYPAPFSLIDLWKRYGGNPAAMYREESRSVADLVTGATARNLTRVFFLQERMRGLGHQGGFKPRTVHVIGGGTMGGDIASWCALQGLRVTIQDVDPQRLAAAYKRAFTLFQNKLKDRRLVEEALDRFIPDVKGHGISWADVVIEAIFEDASAKRELYRQVEPGLRGDALLATNTSSIPLEVLSETLERPERFVGIHFFNPVAKMQLVEVVRGKSVDEDRFNDAIRFVSAINRLPLPVASSPGFLINRILTPYLLEAVRMEEEGIPAAEIDRAAVEFGMPMGPILLADTVGLDICLSVGRILSGHFNIEIPNRLEELVEKGRLGKKSGQGFYNHRKDKGVPSAKKGSSPDENLTNRMMLRLLNEAIACWREGIVPDADLLDAGAIFGIGFAPFHGGPLHYIRTGDIDSLLARFDTLESQYGKRFAPDPGWHDFRVRELEQNSI